MSTLDTLMTRHTEFAAHRFPGVLPLAPSLKTVIIGCVDMRVDPALLLGLELGEAVVVRNIGGRVTPELLRSMALLGMISRADGIEPGGDWNLVVLHHTDCGITRLTKFPEPLAAYFGVPEEGLEAKAVTNPWASVAVDVDALKRVPGLPASWIVSGLVYDVTTGRVDQVVAPSRLRDSEPPVIGKS